MLYFSDKELDDLLLEDIYRGDLTTHALEIENVPATMQFKRKKAGIVAGVALAKKLLAKLELNAQVFLNDGELAEQGQTIIEVNGIGKQLHQAWKVVQLVLEWSCGIAQYMAEMVANAKAANPNAVVACTRKSIPNTRKLATNAVLIGGGHIHRQGLSETILLFSNHRHLCASPNDFSAMVATLKRNAPENKITVEADSLEEEVPAILAAQPDIIQLDKFSLEEVKQVIEWAQQAQSPCQISVAGGVNKQNVAEYAALGINLFITSAPYYAMPEDIKVLIRK